MKVDTPSLGMGNSEGQGESIAPKMYSGIEMGAGHTNTGCEVERNAIEVTTENKQQVRHMITYINY